VETHLLIFSPTTIGYQYLSLTDPQKGLLSSPFVLDINGTLALLILCRGSVKQGAEG